MNTLFRSRTMVLALACLSASAFAAAPEVQNNGELSGLYLSQQRLQMSEGSRLVIPGAWQVDTSSNMLVLNMPGHGGQIAIVEVQAEDAAHAIAAAWARFKPDFTSPPPKLTAQPDANGWSKQALASYEMPAGSEEFLQAQARHAGTFWNVTLSVGKAALFDQRAIDVAIINSSLWAPGFERESLLGRKPHRLDADRIAKMKAFMADGMARLHIPGLAFALLDRGEIVFEGGMGVRQLGKPEPVDIHTAFMNGSTLKPMTTMLMAHLVDQGKLRWEQNVTDVYPAFRLSDAATTQRVQVRHLGCHCTGVPDYQLNNFFGFGSVTPEIMMARIADLPLTTPFGEVYQYSNQMVAAAGFIAGRAAFPKLALGPAYDKAMQEYLFDPLGMSDSTFDMARAQRGNHAVPHGNGPDGKTGVGAMPLNYHLIPLRPAGGGWTSVHDMALFMQFEARAGKLPNGKQLISAEHVLERRVPQVASSLDGYSGMGLGVSNKYGVTTLSHTGTVLGSNSYFFLVPESGIGVVALSNAEQGHDLLTIARQRLLELTYDVKPTAESILAQLVDQNDADAAARRAEVAKPDRSLEKHLAARYAHPVFGKLTVSTGGEFPIFDFGDWKARFVGTTKPDGSVVFSAIDPIHGLFEYRVQNTDDRRAIVVDLGPGQRIQFDEVKE